MVSNTTYYLLFIIPLTLQLITAIINLCGRGGMADAQDSDSCPSFGGVGSNPIGHISFLILI